MLVFLSLMCFSGAVCLSPRFCCLVFQDCFFFQYRSIVRRGVGFSTRMCFSWSVALNCHVLQEATKIKHHCQECGFYFCEFLACHRGPCSAPCQRLKWKKNLKITDVRVAEFMLLLLSAQLPRRDLVTFLQP